MTKTSMWHPTGRRGRGVTVTATSTGGGGLLAPLFGLLVLGIAAMAFYRAVTRPVAAEQVAEGTAFLNSVVSVVSAVGGLVGAVVLGCVVARSMTRREDRVAAAEYAAHVAEVEQARAERAAAVEQAAAALDGQRDGTLIDAAGRFRSLGVFPVDEADQVVVIGLEKSTAAVEWSTDIDQALGDLDRLRADREA